MTPPVHHVALNRLDILAARFGETGQVSLTVYRERTTPETPVTAGLAALAVRSMLRGTTRYTASELAFAMESLGGGLGPNLGADLLSFGATVLSERVRAAAAVLAEVLHQPRFAPESIAIERALLIEDARSVADDMVRFPVQLALGVAFNDVGYGSPSLGSTESLASFTTDSVRQWHAEMLSGGRTTVVAVGDADPEQLAAAIVGAFEISGGRPGAGPSAVPSVAAASPERSEWIATGTAGGRASVRPSALVPGTRTESRDRKQSALAMLFPGPSRHDPERFAAETWGAIAAGLGGRLFESLRSKRSLAYTVIANSWQRRLAGGLLTYIATDPARLDEARAAMLEELAIFRREPPSPDELTCAVAMLAGRSEMSRQTAGGFAGEIADAWLLGSGLAELDDPAAPYRAVTADAVHAVTARSLDPALRAEGVLIATANE